MRRWSLEGAAPLLLLFAVAASLFWPLLSGHAHLVPFHVFFGDPFLAGLDGAADRPDWTTQDTSPVTYFYALKSLCARSIHGGELPLWNPYSGLGMPLLGDGQSQPLSPFFIPFLILPNPWVYSLALVVQLLFGGIGMDRFLKKLGTGFWPRILGAAAFAFNPCTMKYIAYSDVWAYVWFPWVFLAAEVASSEGKRGFLCLSASLALMGLSGHIEEAFLGAVSAILYGLIRARANKMARSRWILMAPVAAALLSAWWILPFLEWVSGSWSVRMVAPKAIPYGPSACFVVGSELLWMPLLLLLALLGARRASLSLALAPAALWASLLLFLKFAWVQVVFALGFMSGRYARCLAWFILVTLAAIGLERALGERLSRKLRLTGTAFIAGWFLLSVLVSMMHGEKGDPARVNAGWLAGTAVWASVPALSVLAGSFVLWLLPPPVRPRGKTMWAAGLATCVVAGCLIRLPGDWALWNGSVPRLAEAVVRVEPSGSGRQWFDHSSGFQYLCPNLSAAFGLRDVRYQEPLTPKRLLPVAGAQSPPWFQGFKEWDARMADFTGVNRMWAVENKGGVLEVRATSNPHPTPRGFWVPRAIGAASAEEALALALKGEAWKQAAFLEGWRASSSAMGGLQGSGGSAASVRCLKDRCTHVSWEVSAPADGWFVLRDLAWPGWRAAVDEKSSSIFAADGVFRAVRLPAGDHVVGFSYHPWSFWGAVWASVLTLGLLLVLPFVRRKSRTLKQGES